MHLPLKLRFLGAAVLIATLLGCLEERRIRGDLEEMRSAGELRVAVRPGYLQSPARQLGEVDEQLLLLQLASRLGLELRWVEVGRSDLLLPALREGLADLAVARFSSSAVRREGLTPSAAVAWVDDLFVTGQGSGVLDLYDVETGALHLHRSNESWLLGGIDSELWAYPVPEEVPLEAVLRRVAGGRYQVTVADSLLLQALPIGRRLRSVASLAERRPLVWAMRSDAPQLRMAVDDYLFAEKVLARAARSTACRDLDAVRVAGVLRLVTRNSPTTCTVERGGLQGFEYDLVREFAGNLGLRLELAMPPPDMDPLQWLELGYGDLAALHEPVAPADEGRFLVSTPYRQVDLVGVLSVRADEPTTVDDLGGSGAAASAAVASTCALMPLRPPLEFAPLNPGADGFTAMLEVARGRRRVAVVDSDAARLELANRPDLQAGPVVLPNVELAWLLNTSAPQLHSRVNTFLRQARRSGLVRQLASSSLTSWQPYVPPHLPEVPEGALTPYDELLQWAGRQHGIDWRLLASLMYEESRFDPYAVGPGGSAGLFQFMPFTWRELGVEDPHHPGEAVEAGATYLRQMMDKFADLEMADRAAMAIASYNVGPRHVFDARRLAREMNLDPDRWSGNVETAMVIIDNPEVARRFPAGVCRCRRAVGYTRRIFRRYAAYAEQFPPR